MGMMPYLLPPFAYLLGSIPVGLVLTRFAGYGDIRKTGSGNIGATNVRRAAGTGLALVTLAADAAKGAFPVWLAADVISKYPYRTDHFADLYPCLVALSALLGHLFPVYLKFRGGGKGVATAAGCFLVLAPLALMVSAGVFALVLWRIKRVSAGSLSGAGALPIAAWISGHSTPITLCALLFSILIFLRHRGNIKRLIDGTEPQFR